MTDQYSIRVIDDDIKNGMRQTKGRCAIARAIAMALPEARRPEVDNDKALIAFTDIEARVRRRWRMSEAVRTWIDRWDRGLPVDEFTLILTKEDLISRVPMGARNPADVGKPKNRGIGTGKKNGSRPLRGAT